MTCRFFRYLALLSFGFTSFALAKGAQGEALPAFHSHNDYERKRPLWDALEAGVRSVEADVWGFWDGLFVRHWPFFGKSGPFESWYFWPMFEFKEREPSLTWDYLWIDIKGPEDRLRQQLLLKLNSSLSKAKAGQKPPEIILSGRGRVKRDIASEWVKRDPSHTFPVWHDAHDWKADDLPWGGEADPWLWYSLNWPERYTWRGQGCLPAAEWKRWQTEVAQIHLKKRKVRYFHVPQTQEWVRAAHQIGVDLIDLDDLALATERGVNSEKRTQMCPE